MFGKRQPAKALKAMLGAPLLSSRTGALIGVLVLMRYEEWSDAELHYAKAMGKQARARAEGWVRKGVREGVVGRARACVQAAGLIEARRSPPTRPRRCRTYLEACRTY